ncbi:MAG: glycine dehydrogenase, partial [Planctomycetales bacterium]
MSYVGNTESQRQEMLTRCGVDSVDALFEAIPEHLRARSFDVAPAKSELEVIDALSTIA